MASLESAIASSVVSWRLCLKRFKFGVKFGYLEELHQNFYNINFAKGFIVYTFFCLFLKQTSVSILTC